MCWVVSPSVDSRLLLDCEFIDRMELDDGGAAADAAVANMEARVVDWLDEVAVVAPETDMTPMLLNVAPSDGMAE